MIKATKVFYSSKVGGNVSADNVVGILKSRNGDGFEYRVEHVFASDFLNNKVGMLTKEFWDDAPVFNSWPEALKFATKQEEEAGYVEYRIIEYELDGEF